MGSRAAGPRGPGEAPACVEYSVGRKALGRDSPRRTTEPSRGAAILLSRGFLGDQDRELLIGSLSNQQAAGAGTAICAGILLAYRV